MVGGFFGQVSGLSEGSGEFLLQEIQKILYDAPTDKIGHFGGKHE